MSDITISYKGNTISELSTSGSKDIKTAGKLCEGDISINYTRPNSWTIQDEGKVINNNTLVAQTARQSIITENNTYDTTYNNSVIVNVNLPKLQENDVTFLDYDGEIVYSYSAADFALLSAMPDNPTHEGLTAQGWNWTLAGAKTYVANHGKIFIGQSYITNDGKTRIYINLTGSRLSPYLGIAVNGTAIINWGDNNTAETVTGDSSSTSINVSHTYATPGKYIITIEVTTGTITIFGNNNIGSYLLWKAVTETAKRQENSVYINSIQKVEIGANCELDAHAFSKCYSLETITIPLSMTSFPTNLFVNCSKMKFITIPYDMTDIAKYSFQSCSNMKYVSMSETITSVSDASYLNCINIQTIVIPDTVTTISTNAFQGMNNLKIIIMPNSLTTISNYVFSLDVGLTNIIIPVGVTDIGNYAFQTCWGLKEVHFKPTIPPTVGNSACFSNLPTDCIIYVPTGKLADYTSAQYYPDSTVYTYIEE